MFKKKLIAVVGPTASGKTALAIQLAQKFDTQIISADSRQVYKELSIGTAKPSAEELTQAKHHFIGSHSITQNYTAGQFEKDGLACLANIFKNKNEVILVGGSGLYVSALVDGLNKFPTIDKHIREKWRATSLETLQEKLKQLDPAYAETVDENNPQRLMRALEVIDQTGKTYSSFLKPSDKKRLFVTSYYGIDWPREQLYTRINQRVDKMIEAGLINEVKRVWGYRQSNALNTVGYKELMSHLNGEISIEKATELIKRNTRRFAKRQLTWFRKYSQVQWVKPSDITTFIDSL